MGKTDIVTGAVMLIFSMTVYILTLGFPGSESVVGGLGPGFFPKMVAGGMMLMGVIVLVRGIVSRGKTDGIGLKPADLKTPALLLVFTVIYIILTATLGFIIATPVFLIFTMIMWRVHWGKAILIGVGMTATLYFFFSMLLRLPLPTGIVFGN